MDNLMSQISAKLKMKEANQGVPVGSLRAPLSPRTSSTDKQNGLPVLPAPSSPYSYSSPRQSSSFVRGDSPGPEGELVEAGLAEGEAKVEVTAPRKDSESYARQTIAELDACLGSIKFPPKVATPPPPDSVMDDTEIEQLSSHIAEALASGLSFKHRFGSTTMLATPGHSGPGEDQEALERGIGEAVVFAEATGGHPSQVPTPRLDLPPRPKDAPAPRPGLKKGTPGLALAVGSQLQEGEWNSQGVWKKKQKVVEIPKGLQTIKPEDMEKVRELGRGCFGSVWLAKWRGIEVALKELLQMGHDTNPMEVFAEAEKLACLRHPCVASFYGIVVSPESYATVMEFMHHGSLRSGLVRMKKKGYINKHLKAGIALQAARGMEYLHLLNMVHFDLKCDNLLCDLRDINRPVVKIGDLGLSKMKEKSFISGNMRGTLPWMAPELFPSAGTGSRRPAGGHPSQEGPEDRVNEKVDVFSFGVCLWEMWTLGDQPYPNLNLQEIFMGVMTGTLRPSIGPECDPEWAALMRDCWQGNPRARPSFSEIAERLEAMFTKWKSHMGEV